MRFLPLLERGLAGILTTIVVVSLSVMSLLTTVDATGRYLLNRPVLGSVELTELLMVALIFAAIPLVTLSHGHVVVDIFSLLVPRRARPFQRAAGHLLACGISGLLATVAWQKAVSVSRYGDLTPMINIPLGPFVYAMSLLLALNALVHLGQLFGYESSRHGHLPGSSLDDAQMPKPGTTHSEARRD